MSRRDQGRRDGKPNRALRQNIHASDVHLAGVLDRAEKLGTEDFEKFSLDETWAGIPTASQFILREEAVQALNNIGEEWRAANRELEAEAVKRLAAYRSAHDQLLRAESDEELQRIRLEELTNDDAFSYDRHRRYERKYNASSVAHWLLLVLFAAGEYPLNLKALGQLGEGISKVALHGLAVAIGVVIIGLAHIGGVFLKRIVTEQRELPRDGETRTASVERSTQFAKSLVVLAAVVVGFFSVVTLGRIREEELENEQVATIADAKIKVVAAQANVFINDSPESQKRLATELSRLGAARQRLCVLSSGEPKSVSDPCGPSPKVMDLNDVEIQPEQVEVAMVRKPGPFQSVAFALTVLQFGMFVVAFAIAFKAHDETLHQVKNQREQLQRAFWFSKWRRFRFKRSEKQVSQVVTRRVNTFGQYLDHAHETSAGYIAAQWAYLRSAMGNRATPEATSTIPLPIPEAPWMFDLYQPADLRTGVRDPDYEALALWSRRLYRSQYPQNPADFADTDSRPHDSIALAPDIRALFPHMASVPFGAPSDEPSMSKRIENENLTFVPTDTISGEPVTTQQSMFVRWPATTRLLTSEVERRERPDGLSPELARAEFGQRTTPVQNDLGDDSETEDP